MHGRVIDGPFVESKELIGGFAVMELVPVFAPGSALASDFEVTTTASVSGTSVNGTIVIQNEESAPLVITALGDWLEVRYASGHHPMP